MVNGERRMVNGERLVQNFQYNRKLFIITKKENKKNTLDSNSDSIALSIRSV